MSSRDNFLADMMIILMQCVLNRVFFDRLVRAGMIPTIDTANALRKCSLF